MKDNRTLANAFFAAYDAHDLDTMVSLCADDAKGVYVPFGPAGAGPVRGGIDAIWKAYFAAAGDFYAKVEESLLAESDTVVVRAILGGTHTSSGHVFRVPHLYLLRFDPQGKVTEITAYWDNTELAALGIG